METATIRCSKRHLLDVEMGQLEEAVAALQWDVQQNGTKKPRTHKTVTFCAEADSVYEVVQDEEDVKNSWTSDEEDAASRKTMELMMQAYHHSCSSSLDGGDAQFSLRGLEHYINPRCQRDKMRNVHTFRRSILHLQYDAEAIAILSASMSAATVREAERLAARDADDAQQVATTTAIRRVASLPRCSFSTTKGWNQSSGPSSAAGAYFMGYSMFSHRKMPRNSSYYVLSSPQV